MLLGHSAFQEHISSVSSYLLFFKDIINEFGYITDSEYRVGAFEELINKCRDISNAERSIILCDVANNVELT